MMSFQNKETASPTASEMTAQLIDARRRFIAIIVGFIFGGFYIATLLGEYPEDHFEGLLYIFYILCQLTLISSVVHSAYSFGKLEAAQETLIRIKTAEEEMEKVERRRLEKESLKEEESRMLGGYSGDMFLD